MIIRAFTYQYSLSHPTGRLLNHRFLHFLPTSTFPNYVYSINITNKLSKSASQLNESQGWQYPPDLAIHQHPSILGHYNILVPQYIPPLQFNHQLPTQGVPEFAFVGRSNVGKSTLLDSLLGNQGLVRTSKSPGCTTSLNYYALTSGKTNSPQAYLIDMPGYGFALQSKAMKKEWEEMIRSYLLSRDQMVLRRVFVLIDSRRGISQLDKQMLMLLTNARLPHQIILTKADLVRGAQLMKVLEDIFVCIDDSDYAACLPFVHVSAALKKEGVEPLKLIIGHVLSSSFSLTTS